MPSGSLASEVLAAGVFSARHPRGNRTSSIWLGHVATVALPRAPGAPPTQSKVGQTIYNISLSV